MDYKITSGHDGQESYNNLIHLIKIQQDVLWIHEYLVNVPMQYYNPNTINEEQVETNLSRTM